MEETGPSQLQDEPLYKACSLRAQPNGCYLSGALIFFAFGV